MLAIRRTRIAVPAFVPPAQRPPGRRAPSSSRPSSSRASSRARTSQSQSSGRRATRSAGSPAWRVPRTSPGPRRARSALGDLEAVRGGGEDLQPLASPPRRAGRGWRRRRDGSGARARPGPGAGGAGRGRSARRSRSPSRWPRARPRPTSITVVATSTRTSPGGEGAHHPLALGGRHAAVEHGDREPRQRLAHPLLHLGQRGGVDPLALLDERAHHVGPGRPPRALRAAAGRPRGRCRGGDHLGRAPACGRAASRRGSRRRGRRRRSARASGGWASPSSPARPAGRPCAAAARAGPRRSGAARRSPRAPARWNSTPSWIRAWVPTASRDLARRQRRPRRAAPAAAPGRAGRSASGRPAAAARLA